MRIKELYEYCPRFSRCSVNKCPLDSHYPNREIHPDDREKRCGVRKSIRVRIHNEHNGNLKYKGMNKTEYAGYMLSQSFSGEENKQI
jgi:hypothetical protein